MTPGRGARIAPGLVLLAACLAAGCGMVEEQRKRARREAEETAVVEAVEAGDVAAIRAALQRDRTLANGFRWLRGRGHRVDYRERSALTQALVKGRRDIVDLLLEHGADPNLFDGQDASPLGVALSVEEGRAEMVALLLEKGADPDRPDDRGGTVLHTLPADEEAIRLVVAKAKATEARDARGATPLHAAAHGANVPALRLLVAAGADPDVATRAPQPGEGGFDDVPGTTPLGIVARDRQIAAAATLCALGADPDAKDSAGASVRQVAAAVAESEGARPDGVDVDVARHRNMAAFLASGGGCDALRARKLAGESVPDVEVLRIANESECEAGWGWACGRAGWAHDRGEGAPEDDARALALYERGCESAATKNEWCCGMAGIHHVRGEGASADPVEGARWLLMGCEPRDPERADGQACNHLGLLHAEGSGVRRDLARARTLFEKACAEGSEEGCANLKERGGS